MSHFMQDARCGEDTSFVARERIRHDGLAGECGLTMIDISYVPWLVKYYY